MPETIKCPDCSKSLRVPEHLLGKTVRCPSCKLTFTALADYEPNPEIVEDEPAPARKKTRREEEYEEERPSKLKRSRRRDDGDDDEHVQERSRRRRRDEGAEKRPLRQRDEEEYDEDEEDYTPRRRVKYKDRGSKSDWLRVRQGIGYILAAIFTMIGACLFLICGSFLAGMVAAGSARQGGAGGAAAGGVGVLIVAGLFFLALLAGLVLFIVGNCFCLRAPQRRGANTLAKVSLGLLIGVIALSLIGTILNMATTGMGGASPTALGTSSAGGIVNLLSNLLSIGQNLVFLFFLRAVALNIQDERLAGNLVYLIIFYIAFLVITIVGVIVIIVAAVGTVASMASGGGPPGSGALAGIGAGVIIGGCIIAVLGLAYIIWYIVMLAQVRGAISTYLFRRG